MFILFQERDLYNTIMHREHLLSDSKANVFAVIITTEYI